MYDENKSISANLFALGFGHSKGSAADQSWLYHHMIFDRRTFENIGWMTADQVCSWMEAGCPRASVVAKAA